MDKLFPTQEIGSLAKPRWRVKGYKGEQLSSEEIAEAIKYIIGNPLKAQQMGENGKKAVLKKYNWSNEEFKLLKLYEELSK